MSRPTRFRFLVREAGDLWFCLTLRGGWTACYHLTGREGRPVVDELRVFPTPPGEVAHAHPDTGEPKGHHEAPGDGLTAATLRDEVVMGRHVYEILPAALGSVRRGVGATRVRSGGQDTTLFDALFGSLGFNPGQKPKRGRRGPKARPDREFAELAAEYIAACEEGSRRPVADIAERQGRSLEAVRQDLYRARKKGLLTRQTAGRAGGQLTPRAKALLRAQPTKGA